MYLGSTVEMDSASLIHRIDQLLRTGPPPSDRVLEKACAVLEKARDGGGSSKGSSRRASAPADEDDDLRSIDDDFLSSSHPLPQVSDLAIHRNATCSDQFFDLTT